MEVQHLPPLKIVDPPLKIIANVVYLEQKLLPVQLVIFNLSYFTH